MADGYIQIADPSTAASNFAIDNLKIVNKDTEPNLKEVEYKSAKLNVPDDWDYTPIALHYEQTSEAETTEKTWYFLIPVVAGVCVIGVGITFALVRRKRKKEGVDCNE